jgi:hypothetical protein
VKTTRLAERSPSSAVADCTIYDPRRAAHAAKDLDNPQVIETAWQ